MNGEIKIFESPEFGQIRTVMDKKGEPWFCLTDVCKVLGLTQRHVRERLEKGVVSTDPLSTRGGTQMANFVNEDGLYDVILDSRRLRENGYIFKKSTEPIQKWVEMGIFATSVTMIHTNHGAEERVTTKVTGKGQEYFLSKLRKF